MSNYPYTREPDPRRSEYVIGVADNLRIRVWGHTELDTEIRVRPDGTITLPLVGDVRAAGLTPTQVRNNVAQALTAFIKSEAVTVTLAVTDTSYRVTVSGKVARPGTIPSQRYLTVSEAVVLAGGPTPFASPNDTVVLRVLPNGESRRIPIFYDELEQGRCQEQDLVLLNGDRIFVP